jgi:peptidoglycan/LPS O-acetylase OafA/YrhL
MWDARLPAPFWPHLAAHVVLLQGVIPQGALPFAYVTLLGPAWSLSTEFQFYVLIGLWAPHKLRLAAFACMAAGLAYHAGAPFLPPWWGFSRAFLPDAAPYFALGLASAAWLQGEGVAVLLVCALLTAGLGFCEGIGRALIPLAWLGVMFLQRHAIGRVLAHPVWQFLGAISYPLYLLNEPVQRGLAVVLAPLGAVGFSLVWLPLNLVVAVLVAWLVHITLEKPARFGRPWPHMIEVEESSSFLKKRTKKLLSL